MKKKEFGELKEKLLTGWTNHQSLLHQDDPIPDRTKHEALVASGRPYPFVGVCERCETTTEGYAHIEKDGSRQDQGGFCVWCHCRYESYWCKWFTSFGGEEPPLKDHPLFDPSQESK